MPCKTKAKQNAYQLNWMRKRREAWFEHNGPCIACGSPNNLELDHKDPKTKSDHKIWSWSKKRREEELAKCQVLCIECHRLKTRWQRASKIAQGKTTMYTRYGCRCYYCQAALRYRTPRRPEAINKRPFVVTKRHSNARPKYR